MAEFVKVASTRDLVPGQCKVADADGKPIALCNVNGTFYALNNTCLHQGGPLGEGSMEATTLTCPWHAWQWDVTTGKSTVNPAMGVACYPVKVEGDDVMVEVG
ncbi:MAG: Rieske 2Fe-2S domain-containing protein [Vicinamibacteria bacterium]